MIRYGQFGSVIVTEGAGVHLKIVQERLGVESIEVLGIGDSGERTFVDVG